MPYVTDPGELDPPGWDRLPPSVRDRVVRIVAGVAGLSRDEIVPELTIDEALSTLNSLGMVRLLATLEQEFGVSIPGWDAEWLNTVEQLAQYLAWKTANPPKPA